MITLCGVQCDECAEYGKTCEGCAAVRGTVFWVDYLGLDVCPIYNCCVNEKHFEHCGLCSELPCRIHFDTKDPKISDEEHRAGLERRVAILKMKK